MLLSCYLSHVIFHISHGKVYPASSILFSMSYQQSFLSFISSKFSILHLSKASYPLSQQSFLSFISAKFPILPLIINVILHLFKRPLMNMYFSMYPITMTVCTFLCTLSQWWYALFYAPYMTLNGWPLYDISSLMACTFLCTLHDTPNCPAISG